MTMWACLILFAFVCTAAHEEEEMDHEFLKVTSG